MSMRSFVVVGLGNPLRRDDGVGVFLIKKLMDRREKLPRDLEIVDGGTGGFSLIHVLSDFREILIVDAVDFGGEPGSFRFFEIDEVDFSSSNIGLLSHERDFFKVISFFRKLDDSPRRIFVFGVQPRDVSFGRGFSNEVDGKIDFLVSGLIEKINFVFF